MKKKYCHSFKKNDQCIGLRHVHPRLVKNTLQQKFFGKVNGSLVALIIFQFDGEVHHQNINYQGYVTLVQYAVLK